MFIGIEWAVKYMICARNSIQHLYVVLLTRGVCFDRTIITTVRHNLASRRNARYSVIVCVWGSVFDGRTNLNPNPVKFSLHKQHTEIQNLFVVCYAGVHYLSSRFLLTRQSASEQGANLTRE